MSISAVSASPSSEPPAEVERQVAVMRKERDVEKATAVMRTHIGRTARHVSNGQ